MLSLIWYFILIIITPSNILLLMFKFIYTSWNLVQLESMDSVYIIIFWCIICLYTRLLHACILSLGQGRRPRQEVYINTHTCKGKYKVFSPTGFYCYVHHSYAYTQRNIVYVCMISVLTHQINRIDVIVLVEGKLIV